MDLSQLNTFVVLARNKNYTKTAEELGYAQSSVSAQIRQLERELGARLFDRIGKRVFLTAPGETFLQSAKEILALAANAKEQIGGGKGRGRIVVGASESVCIMRLPPVVQAFRAAHPDVELRLELIENGQALHILAENKVDIAVTVGRPIEHPSIRRLMSRREELLVLSAPGHPLEAKATLDIADFAGETFIFAGPGCDFRAAFENELISRGVPYTVALEAGNVQAVKEMAASGLGLCVLPRLAAERELERQVLRALPFRKGYNLCLQMTCHQSKWIAPYLDAFIEIAKGCV